VGLVTGEIAGHVTGTTLVVSPDRAVGQIAGDVAEAASAAALETDGHGTSGRADGYNGTAVGDAPPPVVDEKLRRFYGAARLDPERYQRDFGKLAQEIIANLAGHLGTEIEITGDVRATNDEGFPEGIVRTVNENARNLKLDTHGFERD